MKTAKQIILGIVTVAVIGLLTSCNDWLHEKEPNQTDLNDYYVSGQAAINVINGCYTPLLWEYNYTYYSEWFFGDIASDDALKGGQNVADGSYAYDIDNFKVTSANGVVLDYYRAKYQGIGRCNQALKNIPDMECDEIMDEKMKNRLLGEAHFLRAYYYFQLVRLFGGVPVVTDVIDSSDNWQQPRATADEVYDQIISDLKEAEATLWDKNKYSESDLGRATRGSAQAMLCKVYLYRHDYESAFKWGQKFIDDQLNTGIYRLNTNYWDNFTLMGENGPESIFEIQYMQVPWGDYGGGNGEGGNGYTIGTFTTILVRPRCGSDSGWGWNHPTRNLIAEFEEGDPRLEYTVGVPADEFIDDAEVNYLGNPYYNNKYAFLSNDGDIKLDHQSRGRLNYKLIRVSDLLLLYAEAALEIGNLSKAEWALEMVRARARGNATDPAALPAFPGYLGYTNDTESLRQAIRHERRVELAMEGHRWFDLVRWGIAADVMDKDTGSYGKNESEAVRAEMANFQRGKHELFPIPLQEIQLNPMNQNPGY